MDFLPTRAESIPFIRSRQKTLDVRVRYPSNMRWKAGMVIEMKSTKEAVPVSIIGIREYESLDQALQWEGDFKKIVPLANTRAEALRVLEHFCPRVQVEHFGIIVLEIELVTY